MVDTIELQDPIGPGITTPPLLPEVPSPYGAQPDPTSQVGTMDWLRTHRLPSLAVQGSLDPQGPGSELYRPTGELLAHQQDPAFFTEMPHDLYTPPAHAYDLAKPGETARPGQLSLDLLDPFTSINEFGRNMLGNYAPQAGDAFGA